MHSARLAILTLCFGLILGAQKTVLRPTLLPDGSGTLGLPAGWRIASAVNGMVSAEGPEGTVDLGINAPVYTPQAAAAMPFRPPAVAPYGDAAASAQAMLGGFWKVAPQSIRIVDHSPIAWWANGPAATVHLVAASVHHECLFTVLTGSVGFGEFMYYHSGVCTTPEKFDANLPLLLRIWASWKVSDAVYQARLRDAACSLESINRIIRHTMRRRERAMEEANEAWDRIIRGN
jgi:hypothetical protein